ncbi:MAG TPA: glutaredoxin family protein [Pyrinomonadaceae bacterium]|nr:glutaredoxin family protein [Pyrinomonadaceae bacterium]
MARQPNLIHRFQRNWQDNFENERCKRTLTQRAKVILYSKPGCQLCEEMKAEMARADCLGLYELEEINIETDEELLLRYRYDIPVLTINGVEAFRHRLTAEEFGAYLTSA